MPDNVKLRVDVITSGKEQLDTITASMRTLDDQMKSGALSMDQRAEAEKKLMELMEQRSTVLKQIGDAEKSLAEQNEALHGSTTKVTEAFKAFGESVHERITEPLGYSYFSVGKLAEAFGPLGIAAGITGGILAGVGFAATELVHGYTEAAHATELFADRMGISVGAARELELVSRLAGVDAHALEGASRMLAGALEDSEGQGRKAAKALQELGIQTIDTTGASRDLGSVTLDLIEKLSKVEDQTRRTFLASQALPRGAAKEVLPLIENYARLTAELHKYGIEYDQDVIKSAAKGEEQFRLLGIAYDLLKDKLAEEITPIVIPIVTKLTQLISDPSKTIEQVGGWAMRELLAASTGNVDAVVPDAQKYGHSGNTAAPVPAVAPPAGSAQADAQFLKTIDVQRDTEAELHKRRDDAQKDYLDALAKADEVKRKITAAPGSIDPKGVNGLEAQAAAVEKLRKAYEGLDAQVKAFDKDKATREHAPEDLQQAQKFGVELQAKDLAGADKLEADMNARLAELRQVEDKLRKAHAPSKDIKAQVEEDDRSAARIPIVAADAREKEAQKRQDELAQQQAGFERSAAEQQAAHAAHMDEITGRSAGDGGIEGADKAFEDRVAQARLQREAALTESQAQFAKDHKEGEAPRALAEHEFTRTKSQSEAEARFDEEFHKAQDEREEKGAEIAVKANDTRIKSLKAVSDFERTVGVDQAVRELRRSTRLAELNVPLGSGTAGEAAVVPLDYKNRVAEAQIVYEAEIKNAQDVYNASKKSDDDRLARLQEYQKAALAFSNEYYDAREASEEKLLELEKKNLEETRSFAGGVFDAFAQKNPAKQTQDFFIGQAKDIGRSVFSNVMTPFFAPITSMIDKLKSAGAQPPKKPAILSIPKTPAQIATEGLTNAIGPEIVATDANTAALRALTAILEGKTGAGAGGIGAVPSSIPTAGIPGTTAPSAETVSSELNELFRKAGLQTTNSSNATIPVDDRSPYGYTGTGSSPSVTSTFHADAAGSDAGVPQSSGERPENPEVSPSVVSPSTSNKENTPAIPLIARPDVVATDRNTAATVDNTVGLDLLRTRGLGTTAAPLIDADDDDQAAVSGPPDQLSSDLHAIGLHAIKRSVTLAMTPAPAPEPEKAEIPLPPLPEHLDQGAKALQDIGVHALKAGITADAARIKKEDEDAAAEGAAPPPATIEPDQYAPFLNAMKGVASNIATRAELSAASVTDRVRYAVEGPQAENRFTHTPLRFTPVDENYPMAGATHNGNSTIYMHPSEGPADAFTGSIVNHEATHALLNGLDINKINAGFDPKTLDHMVEAIRAMSPGVYPGGLAAEDVVPRLMSGQFGQLGIDRATAEQQEKQLIQHLQGQSPDLAKKLDQIFQHQNVMVNGPHPVSAPPAPPASIPLTSIVPGFHPPAGGGGAFMGGGVVPLDILASLPLAAQPAATEGPAMRAASPPTLYEQAKGFVLGTAQAGESVLGRALGYHYSAPTEAEAPITDLPLLKPTAIAPQEGFAHGAAQFAESMTTVPSVAMLAASGGLIGAAGKVSTVLPRLISAGFSADMLVPLDILASLPLAAQPAAMEGPAMRAASPPTLYEQAKGFVLGTAQAGESVLGRALGYHYSAPTEAEAPITDLPLLKPTAIAPQEGFAHGAAQFAESMTTVPSVAMLAASGGLIGAAGKVSTVLPRLISAGFSADMLHSAYQQYPEYKAAVDAGDYDKAHSVLARAGLTAAVGVLTGAHSVHGAELPDLGSERGSFSNKPVGTTIAPEDVSTSLADAQGKTAQVPEPEAEAPTLMYRGAESPELDKGQFGGVFLSVDESIAAQYGKVHQFDVSAKRFLDVDHPKAKDLSDEFLRSHPNDAPNYDEEDEPGAASELWMFPTPKWQEFLGKRGFEGTSIGKDRFVFDSNKVKPRDQAVRTTITPEDVTVRAPQSSGERPENLDVSPSVASPNTQSIRTTITPEDVTRSLADTQGQTRKAGFFGSERGSFSNKPVGTTIAPEDVSTSLADAQGKTAQVPEPEAEAPTLMYRGAESPELDKGQFGGVFLSVDESIAAQYGKVHQFDVSAKRFLDVDHPKAKDLSDEFLRSHPNDAPNYDEEDEPGAASELWMFPTPKWQEFLGKRGFEGTSIGKDRFVFDSNKVKPRDQAVRTTITPEDVTVRAPQSSGERPENLDVSPSVASPNQNNPGNIYGDLARTIPSAPLSIPADSSAPGSSISGERPEKLDVSAIVGSPKQNYTSNIYSDLTRTGSALEARQKSDEAADEANTAATLANTQALGQLTTRIAGAPGGGAPGSAGHVAAGAAPGPPGPPGGVQLPSPAYGAAVPGIAVATARPGGAVPGIAAIPGAPSQDAQPPLAHDQYGFAIRPTAAETGDNGYMPPVGSGGAFMGGGIVPLDILASLPLSAQPVNPASVSNLSGAGTFYGSLPGGGSSLAGPVASTTSVGAGTFYGGALGTASAAASPVSSIFADMQSFAKSEGALPTSPALGQIPIPGGTYNAGGFETGGYGVEPASFSLPAVAPSESVGAGTFYGGIAGSPGADANSLPAVGPATIAARQVAATVAPPVTVGTQIDNALASFTKVTSALSQGAATVPKGGALPTIFQTGSKSDASTDASGNSNDVVSIGAGIGLAGATYAGVTQAMRDFSKGGARGVIGGIGDVAATAVAYDPDPTGISQAALGAVAMVSKIVTAIMGDPRAERQASINHELINNAYNSTGYIDAKGNYVAGAQPRSISYFGESGGQSYDYNEQGGIRGGSYAETSRNLYDPSAVANQLRNGSMPIPPGNPPDSINTSPPMGQSAPNAAHNAQQAQKPLQIVVNTMDSKSFMDNSAQLASAVRKAMQMGHPIVNEIMQAANPK